MSDKIVLPIAELARENDCPLLAALWPFRERAQSQKVEWIEGGKSCFNYAQITRNARMVYVGDDPEKEIGKTVAEHVHDIEKCLWFGVPAQISEFKYVMGGVRHYLNRDPTKGDFVRIAVLREPMIRRWNEGAHDVVEAISELSLIVKASEPLADRPPWFAAYERVAA